jgi:glycosyltransferase involved in cell wall biosynthesis
MNVEKVLAAEKGSQIVIGWEGLPPYAAAGIRSAQRLLGSRIKVLATRSESRRVVDELDLGGEVRYVDRGTHCSWTALKMEPPEIFIHTGWAYPHWNSLASQVLVSGGKLVIMVDNCEKKTFKQLVGAQYFRLRLRRRYSAAWVPGSSAYRLIRKFGMPGSAIYKGLYGADTSLFSGGSPLSERPKNILFSGQLIHRKGVDLLLQAWSRIRPQAESWRLVVSGEGPYAADLRSALGVEYMGFLPPHKLAETMRRSRFLVLPSREEHWGLVVHEAACSGCGLILSDSVGASEDLLTLNGQTFRTNSVEALADSLLWATRQDEDALATIASSSIRNALSFGSDVCGQALRQIVNDYTSAS